VSIPFTDREMYKAWRANLQASLHTSRSNSHRLLLFYAVECGLKAVLMRRRSITCTKDCAEITEAQHNINKLLDILCAGRALKLPDQLVISKIKVNGIYQERLLNPGQINQIWRYGGAIAGSKSEVGLPCNDVSVEQQLLQIVKWIEGELGQP